MDPGIDDLLASIRDHVLEDVWIGRTRRISMAILAVGLALMAWFGAWDAYRNGHWLALVTNVLLATLAVITLVALYRARFKWCCAAAYSGGVTTVAGTGAFWWYHTGATSARLLPTAICAGAAAMLTVHWLGLVLTPLERSQPDIRMGPLNRLSAPDSP